MTFKLTELLYQNIVLEDHKEVRLRVYADQVGCPPIMVDSGTSHIEVICFKKTFLKIFTECHSKLTELLDHNSNLELDVYLGTIGLLFTTFENRTILNLHESLFLDMVNSIDGDKSLRKEIRLVEALLSSNLSKLNKSSSLWLWYKKLVVLQREKNFNSEIQVVKTCLASAELHPSNYYSWNMLRWYCDIVREENNRDHIFHNIRKFAFSHLKDISAWEMLSHFYLGNWDYNASEYRRLAVRFNIHHCDKLGIQGEGEDITCKISTLITTLADYIDLCEVSEWPPYLTLYKLISITKPQSFEYLKKWEAQVQPYPNSEGRNNHVNDILRLSKDKHMDVKKKFLKKVANIYEVEMGYTSTAND
ncbi:HFL043Cp [Eremothecium sinecaudum]|uniref:HFL043Cp n=1 Tax=Eremothecium sinecaudum TaxID=45286 RepID=A0A120K2K3_9SACH|nr:HFL043Cp [Eremothecium sinecaudum]AMD21813.1 HFL043Cp [Eremothecium sinecaudum]